METTYTCTKCQQSKPISHYPTDKSRKNGIRKTCKECIQQKPSFDYSTVNEDTEMVTCSKCNIAQLYSEYYKDTKNPKGIRQPCKECSKPTIKKYSDTHRQTIIEKKRQRRLDPEVKRKEKDFYKQYYHRPEVNERYKVYRNTDEVKERMTQYRADNLEHIKETIIKRRPIINERNRIRYRTDHEYRLIKVLRSKIHKFLNGITTSYEQLLGCDLVFFRRWIEFRFDDQMTWDNFGPYWHIDHILPISRFNFKRDTHAMKICFHWTNLQPLRASENQQKHGNWHLHYYFNNMVNVFRFNRVYDHFSGHQAVSESLQWLRVELRYGKSPPYEDARASEIGNPQPSSYVRYDKDMEKVQRLDDSGSECANHVR